MKTRFLALIIGVAAFLAGAGMIHQKGRAQLPEEKTNLVLRMIGHRILLSAGDSTSRVLPVEMVAKNTFFIQFENPFTFKPENIVDVIHKNLESAGLPLRYAVEIKTSSSNETVYSYEIINNLANSIIPCLGRGIPDGCYVFKITFTREQTALTGAITDVKFIYFSTLLLLSSVSFIYFKQREKKTRNEIGDAIALGKYIFYFNRQILRYGRKCTALSAKESKLLKVFADNQNQLLDRSRLLKEVWEDEGVIVGRSLDVFVSRLRKKLAKDPSLQLINAHGKGYKLEINDKFTRYYTGRFAFLFPSGTKF